MSGRILSSPIYFKFRFLNYIYFLFVKKIEYFFFEDQPGTDCPRIEVVYFQTQSVPSLYFLNDVTCLFLKRENPQERKRLVFFWQFTLFFFSGAICHL